MVFSEKLARIPIRAFSAIRISCNKFFSCRTRDHKTFLRIRIDNCWRQLQNKISITARLQHIQVLKENECVTGKLSLELFTVIGFRRIFQPLRFRKMPDVGVSYVSFINISVSGNPRVAGSHQVATQIFTI